MKSELATLRNFQEAHKYCNSEENARKTALKDGNGCCDDCESEPQPCSSKDDSYNENLNFKSQFLTKLSVRSRQHLNVIYTWRASNGSPYIPR